jgi:hypothetical protein
MNLQVVPVQWVHRTWPMVSAFIGEALEHAKGDYTLDHVQSLLSTGEWTLVVGVEGEVIHGAATISIFNRPADRVAFITTTGGKLVIDEQTIEQVKAIAASMGATALECAARESMTRLLGRYGFEEKYRIVGVKL